MNPFSALLGLTGPALATLAFAAGVALAGPLTWCLGRLPLQTELARMQTAQAQQQLRAAQALQAVAARGDVLTSTLLSRQSQIDQLQRERRDAIQKVTTGRTCLDGAALRLLSGAPGLRVGGGAAPPGGAAAAGGATASAADIGASAQSERISTDTDVAGWALDAAGRFETCRNRLDALIDWFGPAPSLSATTP